MSETTNNNTMAKNKLVRIIGLAVLAVLLLISRPFKIISPGQRGIIIHLGAVQERIMTEGIHWKIPFIQSIKSIDVRTQKIEVDAPSFSRDIQDVDTVIALNYHLDPINVGKLWQQIGPEYRERIIHPTIQESVKAATAHFTAAELIEQRALVRDKIKSSLVERLQPHFVIVDDFSIVNFTFSTAYTEAIEAKQVAQQDALKAENELRRIKVEAEQRVTTARAEAESIRIQAQAVTQQGGRDYVQLRAIDKWDGILPTHLVPNATVPFLDLGK